MTGRRALLVPLVLFGGLATAPPTHGQIRGQPWARHTIDDEPRGADGVRLADANGDRLPDVVTGWEESGDVKVYLHPGHDRVRRRWPGVTVGNVDSPEDAVFVDLDDDGALDVVSCAEGMARVVTLHWAPRGQEHYLRPDAWHDEPLTASQHRSMWMYCLPMDVDGRHGADLVVGSKGDEGEVGWFESPRRARDADSWRWHPLCKAGWIMSIDAADVDGDGDADLIVSDRRGPTRGCFWLERPETSDALRRPWPRHAIGAGDREWMFLAHVDVDRHGRIDLWASARPRSIVRHRRLPGAGVSWESHVVPYPDGAGTAKAVETADVDLDGRSDLVCSCENAAGKVGVFWMSRDESTAGDLWQAHDISGAAGVKFDLVQPIDLDGDGDLDVLTCEERENLGVVWYENPVRR